MSTSSSEQSIRLARYKENSDQARHHEALRERTTSMVAQTTGILLGLLGFKEGTFATSPVVPLMAAFIILLGLWGIFSSLMFERRTRRHRTRTDRIRGELEPNSESDPKGRKMVWVWVIFHSGIVSLGVAILIIWASIRP
jgi:hypothetical protein